MKLFIAGACFGLAIGVFGVWWAQGQHSATLNEEFVEKVLVIEDGDCAEEFDPDFCIDLYAVHLCVLTESVQNYIYI